ncbi:hypothetical protein PS918_00636 [Pseudomonas fluorescens]|uniref:Uncharacterized protein n=1 Tax=Pseudomonas fluorescens TaxID=294 RepID=A0A5E7R0C6_PSEFL|nr:hypothetical protein PS918_00636 [Pseudomonas fluorescens]
MLAMDVNDNAGCPDERGVGTSIASMLAPTGDRVHPPKQGRLGGHTPHSLTLKLNRTDVPCFS